MPHNGLIGLDLRMWNHAGIGRYIRELFSAMFRLEKPDHFRCLAYEEDHQAIRSALSGANLSQARSRIYSLSEQIELAVFSRSVSLLHVPHFNAPIFCRSKLIVTIHDLIYLKEKRFSGSVLAGLYVRALIAGIQSHARAVIAVSDFTRRDLEETFPALQDRVTVIHEAASRIFTSSAAQPNTKKFGLGDDYVLFVGSLKAHKNLPVLLDAFESLRKEGNTSVKLAIVGRKDVKETALLDRLERSNAYVCYLGEQTDEDLADLYRGARALVIPSLWEGFGLTVLEAMACGTPVISSDRASLPEVVGDAGLLFDPTQTEALKEHLCNVLKSDPLRETLSRKGLERAKQFSWDIAARETLDCYKEALV